MEREWTKAILQQYMDCREFGMEKESLRVDGSGLPAQTRHPFPESPNVTRDFCENQLELITDVFGTAEEMLNHMCQLERETLGSLQQRETGSEWLWPFSNPPRIRGEQDIPIAEFKGDLQHKTVYRSYLAEKYGKRKMLFSGIHLNYSFGEELIKACYTAGKQELTFQDYKSQMYLRLAKQVVIHSWFIVYLTAASPVADASFLCKDYIVSDGQTVQNEDDITAYASGRCSSIGYWNTFVPILDYSSLSDYVDSIEDYVTAGQLKAASELYYPVRLKPKGENSLENLRQKGVNHIELRMLDVNPLTVTGLFTEDVEFLHYAMVYFMQLSEKELGQEEQLRAIENMKQAARLREEDCRIWNVAGQQVLAGEEARKLLESMKQFYEELGNAKALEYVEYQCRKLEQPRNRYADRICQAYGQGYASKGMALACRYGKELLQERAE